MPLEPLSQQIKIKAKTYFDWFTHGFTALPVGYTYLLQVLISSLGCLGPLIGQSNTPGLDHSKSVEKVFRNVANWLSVVYKSVVFYKNGHC